MYSLRQAVEYAFNTNQTRIAASLDRNERSRFLATQLKLADRFRKPRSIPYRAFQNEIAHHPIVAIGSFHSLCANGLFFVDMLRKLSRSRSIAIALDFVPPSQKNDLDRGCRIGKTPGTISWNFGNRCWLDQLFRFAQESNSPVFGIKGGNPLQFKTLDSIRKQSGADQLLVYCGEQKLLERFDETRILAIHQNPLVPNLLHQAIHRTYQVNNRLIIHHTHLISVQQSYLLWLQGEHTLISTTRKEVKSLVYDLIGELKIPVKSPIAPQIVTWTTLDRLSRHFKGIDRTTLLRQIRDQQNYYFTAHNLILIASISAIQIFEELLHFIKFRFCDFKKPKNQIEAFIYQLLHEALAYWGTLSILGKRTPISRPELLRTIDSRRRPIVHIFIQKFESGGWESYLDQLTTEERYSLVHYFGYRLGDILFRRASQLEVLKLFRSRSSAIPVYEGI